MDSYMTGLQKISSGQALFQYWVWNPGWLTTLHTTSFFLLESTIILWDRISPEVFTIIGSTISTPWMGRGLIRWQQPMNVCTLKMTNASLSLEGVTRGDQVRHWQLYPGQSQNMRFLSKREPGSTLHNFSDHTRTGASKLFCLLPQKSILKNITL